MDDARGITDAYANMMPIIQSSGTGKSRMVDELAKIEFVFPFNLREADTMTCESILRSRRKPANLVPAGFAHPVPDHEVRRFLISYDGTDKREVGMYYCAFLIALFESAEVILDKCPPHDRKDVASWWRGYLEQNRSSFYKKVIDQSNSLHETLVSQAVRILLDPSCTSCPPHFLNRQ